MMFDINQSEETPYKGLKDQINLIINFSFKINQSEETPYEGLKDQINLIINFSFDLILIPKDNK
jgi:hypothetical protein